MIKVTVVSPNGGTTTLYTGEGDELEVLVDDLGSLRFADPVNRPNGFPVSGWTSCIIENGGDGHGIYT